MGISQPSPTEPQRQERVQIISGIKSLKARRISQPKNAFVWMDLARLYVTLGQIAPAQEALQVARALAPN